MAQELKRVEKAVRFEVGRIVNLKVGAGVRVEPLVIPRRAPTRTRSLQYTPELRFERDVGEAMELEAGAVAVAAHREPVADPEEKMARELARETEAERAWERREQQRAQSKVPKQFGRRASKKRKRTRRDRKLGLL